MRASAAIITGFAALSTAAPTFFPLLQAVGLEGICADAKVWQSIGLGELCASPAPPAGQKPAGNSSYGAPATPKPAEGYSTNTARDVKSPIDLDIVLKEFLPEIKYKRDTNSILIGQNPWWTFPGEIGVEPPKLGARGTGGITINMDDIEAFVNKGVQQVSEAFQVDIPKLNTRDILLSEGFFDWLQNVGSASLKASVAGIQSAIGVGKTIVTGKPSRRSIDARQDLGFDPKALGDILKNIPTPTPEQIEKIGIIIKNIPLPTPQQIQQTITLAVKIGTLIAGLVSKLAATA